MAFPTTPVITNFTGADEAPLVEGGLFAGQPIRTTINPSQMRRVGNQAAPATSGFSTSESYIDDFTAMDTEVYGTVATLPTNNTDWINLFARIQNPHTTSVDFYQFEWVLNTGGLDSWDCYRCTNEAFTLLGTWGTRDLVAGEKVGFEVTGSNPVVLRAFVYNGSSWSQVGSDINDSSANRIDSAGYIGFGAMRNNSVMRWDDLGGGEIVIPPVAGSYKNLLTLGAG